MKKTKSILIVLAAFGGIVLLWILLATVFTGPEPEQPTHPGWNESQRLGAGDELGEHIHGERE